LYSCSWFKIMASSGTISFGYNADTWSAGLSTSKTLVSTLKETGTEQSRIVPGAKAYGGAAQAGQLVTTTWSRTR
jgi:hypothetical protein